MKLNEKSVAHYATCSSPPDKTGFLLKKGERNPTYHRRWCVLKGNMLFYFEERETRDPLGVIVLEGCTVELCESESEEFAFAVRFECTRARVYKLAAESQAAMESWVKALSRASFDYMRLVVRELERQLEEVQQGQRSPQGKSKPKPKKQSQGSTSSRSKPAITSSQAPPSPVLPSEPSEEGLLSLGIPGKENGVSWNKPSSLVNGTVEPYVPGVAWEGDGEGAENETPPPPVPPRRKTPGGSLEEPVSPGTSFFSKLHEWYGKEVAELREEWLQNQ